MKLRICTTLAAVCLVALGGCGDSGSTPSTNSTSGVDAASGTSDSGVTDAGGKTDTASGTADVSVVGGGDAAGDASDCCKAKGATCGNVPGCAKFCGSCPTGKQCDTKVGSKTQYQCIAKAAGPVLKKLGEACGPSAECKVPANNATQEQQSAYRDCVNAQCESGMCNGGYCTKTCNIQADAKNNATGAAQSGGDGIEDPDVASDCEGFIDGPAGPSYKCVQYTSPAQGGQVNICTAGTTFKPCKANSDCTGGEVCSFHYIRGAYALTCSPAMKEADGKTAGQDNGGACNDNPAEGKVQTCKNNLCLGFGSCVDFCKSDSDCTAGGQPMYCRQNVKVFGQNGAPVNICYPKNCYLDEDCKDPNYYCLSSYNGVQNQAGDPDPNDPSKIKLPSWEESICVKKAPDTAKKGEACDDFPGDADTSVKACENKYWCVNGVCGSHCKSDANCAANQKCGVYEIPFDTSDPQDDKYDVYTALKICWPMPGAKGLCNGKTDCTDAKASYCRALEVDAPAPATGTNDFKYTLQGQCIEPQASLNAMGTECGAAVSKGCQSGFCLGSDAANNQPGYCTDLCGGKADCADTKIDIANGQVYKFACRALMYSYNETAAIEDNLYVPLCLPQPPGSSLADCSADFKCAGAEACAPYPIATGPDKAAKVEYRCLNITTQGKAAPSKKTGEACNPDPQPGDAEECISGFCMPDSVTGKGYCSALCKSNADCGSNDGMFCDTAHQAIARKDASKAAVVPMCLKAKACIPCAYDFQCSGKYACTWTSATAQNGACAPNCESDADCAKTDGGAKCEPALGFDGKPTGKKVCTATCK